MMDYIDDSKFFDINAITPRNKELEGIHYFDSVSDKILVSKGSKSEVWKGNSGGKAVIIKVISEKFSKDAVTITEFNQEISILSRISHSHTNLIELHGKGFHQDRIFMILEYLDGGTLGSRLERINKKIDKPFTTLTFIQMATQLSSALNYLHTQFHPLCTIIHRDLKPQNVAFTSTGILKLFDFGLCVCVRKDRSIDGYYELSGNTGSLRYMAPEVLLNQPYNEKVDMYSYGLILYETVTGTIPFHGYTKDHLFCEILNNQINAIQRINSKSFTISTMKTWIDSDIQLMIIQCCTSNPLERWSASKCVHLLRQQLSSIRRSQQYDTYLSSIYIHTSSNTSTRSDSTISTLHNNSTRSLYTRVTSILHNPRKLHTVSLNRDNCYYVNTDSIDGHQYPTHHQTRNNKKNKSIHLIKNVMTSWCCTPTYPFTTTCTSTSTQ